MKLDGKFYGVLVKAKNNTIVPDDEYVVFLAKDNAFLRALAAYKQECINIGAGIEQITSVQRLIDRVDAWREANPDKCKTPDVERGEKMLDGNVT